MISSWQWHVKYHQEVTRHSLLPFLFKLVTCKVQKRDTIRKIIYSPTFWYLTDPNPINISDMTAFKRNKTYDSKVAVIVFIGVLTGMGARPFTAGFLNRLFYHEKHMLEDWLSMKIVMSVVKTFEIGQNLFERVVRR